MPICWKESGHALTAQIVGEIDHHAARRLMEEIGQKIDIALPKELCVDMNEVTFMDSSGIALVLRAWRKMGQIDGVMTLCSVPAQSAKVLKAAGVDRLIRFANPKLEDIHNESNE